MSVSGYRTIGRSIVKPDAYAKVTGSAQYAADLRRPNLLFGMAVRSPHAHALIKEIDVRPALALPGVKAVLTAADIPGKNRVGMTGAKEQPVLAEERVRFYGEAVAVLAAVTPEVAAEACRRVKVVYEELPQITSLEESLAPGAPSLGDNGNICVQFRVIKGEPEEALKQCEVTVEGEYQTAPVEHAYLEPEAVLAEPDGDGMLVWSTTKSVHHDRAEIARVLGWPLERIHVVAPAIGGSFGGKPDLPLNCMAALLAARTGSPVRMVYAREESLQVSTKRHACVLRYVHGAKKDGTLVYVRLDALADAGAYKDYSSTVLQRMVIHAAGPYRVPHVWLEVRGVLTNNPVAGAMRGFGVPQVAFACERQMDRLAHALGMDPLELRLKNALTDGDSTATGQVLPGAAMRSLLLKVRDLLPPEEWQASPARPGRAYEKEGWGIGCFFYGNGRTGLSNPGLATARVSGNGLIELMVGSPDIGQGSDTIFAQIVAEVLGIEPRHVVVVSADTRCTPDSGTTSGTRLTAIVGRAVEAVAGKLKHVIAECASRAYGVDAGRIRLRSGATGIEVTWPPDGALALARLCRESGVPLEASARYDPPTSPLNASGQGNPYANYTFGLQAARVAVNTLTGRVEVKKIVAAYDVGTVVNPCLLRGQIEGGVAMGIGYALSEELKLVGGRVINANFDSYIVPTSMDVAPVQIHTLDLPDREGPFGAKGIGEPATIPTAAAIANAVSRATGVQFFRLPLSLEEIVAGVAERERGRE